MALNDFCCCTFNGLVGDQAVRWTWQHRHCSLNLGGRRGTPDVLMSRCGSRMGIIVLLIICYDGTLDMRLFRLYGWCTVDVKWNANSRACCSNTGDGTVHAVQSSLQEHTSGVATLSNSPKVEQFCTVTLLAWVKHSTVKRTSVVGSKLPLPDLPFNKSFFQLPHHLNILTPLPGKQSIL